MAGVRGNTAYLMFAKQASKGVVPTIAAGTTFKVPFSGGDISPARAIDQLAETDSSRDQGVSFARSGGVDGTPEAYVRDESLGALLAYVLGTGSDAITGTTNITHTLTPQQNLPYVTFWANLGDLLFERYNDAYVSSLTVRAGAGDPLTAAITVNGLSATRLTTDPDPVATAVVPLASSYVYNFNDATVTLSGGATALVSSFEVTIDNNVTRQQTDDFVATDLTAGQRQVSLGFDLIFSSLSEYNAFHYGSTSGTTQNRTIYTTDATFQFDNGVNNQIKFALPKIAYEEFPAAPNVGGDPVVSSVRAVGQRPGGATPIITATVKNQVTGAYA